MPSVAFPTWPADSGRGRTAALAALSALAGLAAFVLGQQLAESRAKVLIAAVAAVLLVAASVVSRRPRVVLLFGWAVSLTYNRQYFSFDSLFGDAGSAGLYWVIGDPFFGALLLLWLYEATVQRQIRRPAGPALWPYYLPFAGAAVLSVPGAEHADWGVFEVVRVAKVGLVLWYVRRNVGREEFWGCIAGFGFGMVAQALLGIIEVASGRSGVLWMFGLQQNMDSVPEMYKSVEFYGWVRATATMAHPPNLACYLMITIPLFVALSQTAHDRRLRAVSLAAAGVGLAGLGCTLSRFPWALCATGLVLLFILLVAVRLVPITRALGVAAIGAFVAAFAVLPFTDLIADRMSRDFQRSIDHREAENAVAINMGSDHALTGVGLNNYRAHMAAYGSELAWALNEEDVATQQLHVRYIAGPLNAYLLLFAETGLLGVAAFLWWLAGVGWVALRAVAATSGQYRAITLAMLVGFLTLMIQQVLDYSYWVDPVLYTFAIQVALLNSLPPLYPAQRTGASHA